MATEDYSELMKTPEEKVGGPDDEIIECALCDKKLWFMDSWAPGDEAICSECDTEVTGRQHPPTIPVPVDASK